MDMLITFCAKYLIFIVVLVAFGYWLTVSRRQKTEVAVVAVVTGIVAFIFAKIGSSLFNDPRPFVSDHVTPLFKYVADNGFPSDHTLLGMIITLAVLSVSRRWGVGLFILTVIVGSARVLAGVHHPVDIIGSIIFGLLGGAVAVYAMPRIVEWLSTTRYAKQLGLHKVHTSSK